MEVTIEEAYAEACQALGEALVRERILTSQLARLTSANAAQTETESTTI
jgi:hypothetical protein